MGPGLASNWYRIGFLMTYWWSEPELTLDWAPVCLELTSDRHRIGDWSAWYWQWTNGLPIVRGLTSDWYCIGTALEMDWKLTGTGLAMDWHVVGIILMTDWHLIVRGLTLWRQLSLVPKLCCPESSRFRIVLVPLTKWGFVTRIGIGLAMAYHCIGNGYVWRVCCELGMMAFRDTSVGPI